MCHLGLTIKYDIRISFQASEKRATRTGLNFPITFRDLNVTARAPTLEESQKLVDYPDRIIEAIVDNMMSSVIRIRTFD
ncbi:MAG TPA: hypothetical protein VF220_02935 [Nitrososphaeraceae archaeon]